MRLNRGPYTLADGVRDTFALVGLQRAKIVTSASELKADLSPFLKIHVLGATMRTKSCL